MSGKYRLLDSALQIFDRYCCKLIAIMLLV
jgi:hypothetical protein